MPKVAPLKALFYNQDKVKAVADVMCPPYDVISEEQQDYFHKKSPYNLIHILLGKDTPEENRYIKAGRLFEQWLKSGVLIQDNSPSFYLYSQQFIIKGERKTRVGFIGLLSLDNPDSSTFGHENTRLEPKEDRLRILKSVKANLSPIFVMFPDKKRVVSRLASAVCRQQEPFLHVSDEDKTAHTLWKVDSPQLIEMVQSQISKENFFIADGHHRYEVACTYRAQQGKKNASASRAEKGYDFILAYFINADSKGLTVLPIHRLVKTPPGFETEAFISALQEYFDVEYVKDAEKFLFLLQKAGRAEHVIGMYKDKKRWLVRLKNVRILEKVIADKPPVYRKLDVSILNYLILRNILNIQSDDKEVINYYPSEDAIIDLVDSSKDHIGFFLNPVKVEEILAVAESGNKMPPKSTYFYPKLLSGLVLHKQ